MQPTRQPHYEVRTYSRQHTHLSVSFACYEAARAYFNKAEKDRDDFVSILLFAQSGPAVYLLTR